MLPRLDQQEDGKYTLEMLKQRNVITLLESIKELPKSAQQLAIECNIPLSTTYRTIGELARLNFIKVKYTFNESGKWEKIYKYNEFFTKYMKIETVTYKSTNSESGL